MSTPTPTSGRTTTAVPTPRPPADATIGAADRPPAEEATTVFGRHGWLVPALGVACVLAVFLAMVLLTWVAGGGTPFDR